MTPSASTPPDEATSLRTRISAPGWDAFLLAVLVFAVLQITALAEASALPTLVPDVLRHPILGNLLPASGEAAMGDVGPRPGDPVGLMLHALTLGLLLAYFVVDLACSEPWRDRLKWVILVGTILTAVYLPTAKLILLREQSGPASYTHDGGVIQTEAATQFFVEGRNPYVVDYTNTPMAEWGFSRFRTALYHYPYLPWTFIASAPFYLAGRAIGFYDQRWLYMLLMTIALFLSSRLAIDRRAKLALVAILALNPLMALDLIFGQNDAFVLSWLLFSLVSWHYWKMRRDTGRALRWPLWASAIAFGLACASKPTAWFLAPFYGMLLAYDHIQQNDVTWTSLLRAVPSMFRRGWPALAAFLILVGPYALWDGYALYDDVWRWSSGKGDSGYQIWGWGASNFVLGFGLVTDRFDQWPFWLTEILVALPLLIWFVRRQQRVPSLSNACWHYSVLLFAFFYTSRFLNENYLGYILAFLAIGLFSSAPGWRTAHDQFGSS